MNNEYQCIFCQNPNSKVTRYSNFKHYWYRCNSCYTMWRKNKSEYPFSSLLRLIDKIPLFAKIERRILPSYLRRQNAEEAAYQSYGALFHMVLDPTVRDEMFEVKRKRYLSEAKDLLDLFKKHSIQASDKDVLDISGGPGTFAYFIKPYVKSIVVTEYGSNSVDAMSEYLKDIKVIHADINDKWTEKETFDVILYRSCLYFCNDFDKHLKDINQYLRQDGLIYICTTAPSLGNSLRWQFEDYTHNVLYSQEVVAATLIKNNFSVIDKGYTDFYDNFLKYYTLKDKIFHSWGIWNILRKGRPKNLDARAHWILAKKNR
jgi:SAM-dependent methyltransferase